jgi:ribosomal-protein-alanine N-acetyltransferase
MSFPAEHPVLETPRLRIRRVERADVAPLLAVNGDDEVTRYLPYASWNSIADGEAWYERAEERHRRGEAIQFVAAERMSGRILGTCLLFHLEAEDGRAEVGYVLGREHWGAGFMREALAAVLTYAFDGLKLRRLEAEIDPRNDASARLLSRLGFTREAVLRQRFRTKGEVTDSWIYGLLRSEWPVPPRRDEQCRTTEDPQGTQP